VPWFRRLVTGISPRRSGFNPGSVHVGFVVGKVVMGQVFPRVFRFSPVNFILSVLHYTEKQKKLIVFITGLHNKPQDCGASVASAAGPFTPPKNSHTFIAWTGISCVDVRLALYHKFHPPPSPPLTALRSYRPVTESAFVCCDVLAQCQPSSLLQCLTSCAVTYWLSVSLAACCSV
jgi:hypothetical protein